MGHEFTGTVVEKGDDVKTLSVGDVIVSPFTTSWYDSKLWTVWAIVY
jgi:threonine dehydrogenase-like Zn-dependent dehydrogenase